MLALLVPLALTATPTSCDFKDYKQPPTWEVERREGARVKFSADPKFFQCAKKAGGTLELVWRLGEKEPSKELPPKKLTSYGENEQLFMKELCASGPGEKKVSAELVGKGAMEKLSWKSPVGEVYCERCELNTNDNMFVVHVPPSNQTPKGMYTVEGTLQKDWFECAKAGSTLELWVYAMPTELEAREAKEPTHKIQGLEAQHYKKAFSQAAICKAGPKFIGYELHGTGEFQVLNTQGRGVSPAKCP